MTERIQDQSEPDAGGFSSISPAAEDRVQVRRKGCACCGNPFGLVRRRRHGRQFCSVACMEAGADSAGKAGGIRTLWYELFQRRREPPTPG